MNDRNEIFIWKSTYHGNSYGNGKFNDEKFITSQKQTPIKHTIRITKQSRKIPF